MATPTIPSDLLSIYDVTFMFDRNLQAIYRWRRKFKMPFHNIPGTAKCPPTRYSLQELIIWAEKHRKKVVRMPKILSNGKITWPGSQRNFEAYRHGITL